MSCVYYHNDHLFIEKIKLEDLAEQFGTPCYVYSQTAIEKNWQHFANAFKEIPHRICYAVKANSNLAILQLLARLNSGFDIVSSGEMVRVLKAGGDAKKIIFSGVGKTAAEIEEAIKQGIFCFDVESQAELILIQHIAEKLKTEVKLALRVNPNVNPRTHAYISTGLKENKFGIEITTALTLCEQYFPHPYLKLIGLACHIGSQITDLEPFSLAIDCLITLYDKLKKMGITLSHLNIGGGLGITYHHESPPAIAQYAKLLKEKLNGLPIELIIEPGRAIVGNAGVLLARVTYLKSTSHQQFAILDAGMNDLLRPALYQAWQDILPLTRRDLPTTTYEVVGPVCESADFIGKNRELAILQNDLVCIATAGAYGFCMSSNYNSRTRAAEVLVAQDRAWLIRRRETIHDLLAHESLLPTSGPAS